MSRFRPMTVPSFSFRAAAALASACLFLSPARAFDNYASLYWNGGGGTWDTTNAEWTTSAGLVTGLGAWNNTQNLSAKFNGAGGTVSLVDPITVAQITFETDGYTLTGSPITFATNTGFISVASGHSQTIESALNGYFFYKTGAGTLTLKGANTYTGTTMIQDGTVVLAGGSIGNSTTSNAQVVQLDADTSAFRVEAGTFTAYAIRANKGSVTATGENAVITVNNINIGVTSGSTAYFTIADGANVTALTGGTSIGGSNTHGIASISGSASSFTSENLYIGTAANSTGSFTQTGGTVTINNSVSIGGASSTGSYTLEGGTLSLGSFGAATGSTFELAGGTLKFNKAGGGSGSGLTLRADTTSTINTNGFNASLSAPFIGTGLIRKTGAGILTVTADNSGYAQNLRVEGGGLGAGSDTAFGTGRITFGADATLQPSGINGVRTVANDITVENGVTVTLNSIPDTSYNNSALTLSGDIDGAGALKITSSYSYAGVTTLSGDNTYTGGTTLSAGILALGSDTALGTGTLTIEGNSQLRSSGDHSLANAVTINTGVTATIGGTDALTLAGAINGGGTVNIINTGVTTLAGDNSGFTGAIILGDIYSFTEGHLRVTHANALGSTADGTTVNSFSSLTLDNVAIGNETLGLRGAGSDGSGALIGTGVSSFAGNITLNGNTTIGGTGTLTLSGNIGEFYENTDLTKVGPGTLILSGNNSNTGFVFVKGGALTLQSSTALGGDTTYAAYVDAGAALQLQGGITTGNRYLVVGGDETAGAGVLRNLSGNNTWLGSVDTQDGGFIESVAGTLTLSGTVSAYSLLNVGGSGDILISGYLSSDALTKTGSGTLTLTNDTGLTGVTTISGGTLQVGNGGTTGSISSTSNVVNNGTLAFNRSDNFTFNKVISGTGALEKDGAGTLTLSAINTYEGGTLIKKGLISFTNANRFGSGNITFDGGGLRWGSSTTTDLSARFNAIGDGGALFDTGSNSVAFASVLTGTGGITKAGSGTLTLNAANTYAGPTTVSAGTLTLGSNGSLGSTTAAVTVSGGTLNLGSKTITTGAVTVAGGSLSTGTLTGTSYDVQSGTVSTILAGGGALEKTTSGTVTLSGANTFSGGATVSAGTLSVTVAGALGTGALTLDGGTLEVVSNSALALNRNTTVSSDSTIAVNRSSSNGAVTHTFGTLSIGQDTLTLTRGATGTGTGGITFGATTLTGDATFAPGSNTLLTLASVTGTDTGFTVNGAGGLAISGAFSVGNGDLTLNAGSLTLNGTTSYDATTVSGGSLTLGTGANLGSGLFTQTGGSVLYTNTGGLGSRSLTISGGTFGFTAAGGAGTGIFTLNGGGLLWSGTNTLDVSSRLNLTGNATFDTGSNSVVFGTALDTDYGITKAGSGTLTLAAGTTINGLTSVSAGTLRTTDGTVFGSSGVSIAGGGTLRVTTDSNQSMSGAFTVTGSGTATFAFDRATAGAGTTATFGALSLGSQVLTLSKTANITSGTPTLYFTGTSSFGSSTSPSFTTVAGTLLKFDAINGNSQTLKIDGNGDFTVLGTLSSIGGFAMNSTGVLTLAGTANTYTTRTTVNAGTVVVTKLADLGQASSLGAPTSAGNGEIWLGYTSTGTLRYVGDTNSSTNRVLTLAGNTGIGSIVDSSGTGTVTFTSAVKNLSTSGNRSLTLTGSNTGLNTLGGALSNPTTSGATSLIKSGAGTWVLSGINTYTGATSVNAGSLFVNGSLGNTAVTVKLDATLGGTGSIGGPTTIQSGGHLAPGAPTGTITFKGGLNLNSGAILDFELGSSSGKIVIFTGTTLTGPGAGKLTVNLFDADSNFTAGTYTLIDATGATLTSIGATNFQLGTVIAGYDFSFTQTGNLIELTATAVPEPAACAALAGALALALAFIRRRARS
jgi:fibronectin-binding autotransporter adhesin